MRDARGGVPGPLLSLLLAPFPSSAQGSGAAIPGITLARSGSKVVSNGAGQLVTLTTDQPGLEASGLLIESAHTNLATDSNTFGNGWGCQGCTISTGEPGPDGSATSAARLIEGSTSAAKQLYYFAQAVSETVHTATFAIKAGSRSWAYVWTNYNGVGGCWFNLGTGATGSCSSGVSGQMAAIGGGWYAASVVFDATPWFPPTVYAPIILSPATGDQVSGYQGDGASYILVASLDFIEHTGPLSHITTAGIAGATGADIATAPAAVLPTSSGRIELDFAPSWSAATGTPALIDSRDGNGLGLWFGFLNGANAPVFAFGGSFLIVGGAYTLVPGTTYHVKATWGGGNCALYINGVLQGAITDGSATPPTGHGTVHIGNDYTGGGQANGHIENIRVWPR